MRSEHILGACLQVPLDSFITLSQPWYKAPQRTHPDCEEHHRQVGDKEMLGGDSLLGRTQKVWGSRCLISSKMDPVVGTPARLPHLCRGWAMVSLA